jgi:hypothetical protein
MMRPSEPNEGSTMGVTTFFVKVPMAMALLLVAACAGVSAFAAFLYITPRMDAFVANSTGIYDEILPEITIRNGRASIDKPQPYFVHGFLHENVTLIIDTREGKQGEALNYLRTFDNGSVVTHDALVIKLRGQIRIVPLKGFPDLVLNSQALRDIANRLLPRFVSWVAAIIVAYFIVAKALQVFILAAAAYAAARFVAVCTTYGQWLRICSFAMIPPVCLDLFQYLTTVNVPGGLPVYFALYGALVLLAGRSLYLSQHAS